MKRALVSLAVVPAALFGASYLISLAPKAALFVGMWALVAFVVYIAPEWERR